MMARQDLASARLLYERAATAGSAPAAAALGRIHDPLFHRSLRVRGFQPDADRAETWYRRAIDLGDGDAAMRLRALEDWRRPEATANSFQPPAR